MRRFRWVAVGAAVVMLIGAFLAFRPDKLFVDDAVDESLADAFVATTLVGEPPGADVQESSTTTVTAAPPTTGAGDTAPTTTTTPEPATTTTQPKPTGPRAVSSGAFYGIGHSAEGTATVYEQDGLFVLRFEDDTDIQNGPDLFVWVLESDDYDGGNPGPYIDLGKLKGNIGGQNYELPNDFDPDIHRFVLVWCKRFSTPFAAAPIA